MACQRLDKSSALDLVRNNDTFVCDCDGVLWNPHGIIKGSVETVKNLRQMGKKVLYITNNCSKTRSQYVQKLNQLGFQAGETDVMCTSYMAAMYLNNRKFKGKVYLVGNRNIAAELNALHIQYFGEGPDPIFGDVEDWVNMEADPDVRCVLVGNDPEFNYLKIARAARYLERSDCILVATNMDLTFPPVPVRNSTVTLPGTGTLVLAVASCTNRQPVLMGKPRPLMFEELKKLHNLDPQRCVMIGDTVGSDIGLAKAAGLKSVLVLSGVTRESQLPSLQGPYHDGTQPWGSSTDPPVVPDFYTDCLGDLVNLLK